MRQSPFEPDQIKIAVIGGGTGSFTLLSSLKNHTSQLAALVSMADNGGSTGTLRDELGVLPPGDVRQCLVALSRAPEVRDLFNYRFDSGSLKGHAFGNLFLTALEKMTGEFTEAVELASKILNIVGRVEPITLDNVQLVARLPDGTVGRGEFEVTTMDFSGQRPELWLEPAATANPMAILAIEQADIVVVAPGGLYGSLAPALIVDGVGAALRRSRAVKIYVSNLVTKPGQTSNFSVQDLANEIERLAGGEFLDAVLYNTETPDRKLIAKYTTAGEELIALSEDASLNGNYRLIGAPLVASDIWHGSSIADPMGQYRTLIRHDSSAVAQCIIDIYSKLAK